MENRRYYDSLFSVFDLTIREALDLPNSVSIRVMFMYEREENERKFVILNTEIQKDMHDRLSLWLEENIDVDDIAYGLKSNQLDADNLDSRRLSVLSGYS